MIVSIVSDAVTNDAETIPEAEQAHGEADDEGAERGGGVAGGKQPGERPWPRQQYGGEDEPGHRIEQEQWPVRGDLAVALEPQVEMDVPIQASSATQPRRAAAAAGGGPAGVRRGRRGDASLAEPTPGRLQSWSCPFPADALTQLELIGGRGERVLEAVDVPAATLLLRVQPTTRQTTSVCSSSGGAGSTWRPGQPRR